MSPIPRPGILDIAPYVPGKAKASGFENPIKLSANENPLGCSEAARDAYLKASTEIHLYPDSNTSALRRSLSEKYELEPNRLVFGAGSDEIFAMACQAFLSEGDNVVQPQYGFAAWAIAARAVGGLVKSAAEPNYVVDVDAMLGAVGERTRIVFVANPANPTGSYLKFAEIERLHANLRDDVLLILDGAYAECAHDLEGFSDGLDWSRDKSNVLVTRTFSKMYGLASLRVGWAYGPEGVVEALQRIRLPFSVPRAGEAAAVAALADERFLQQSLTQVRQGRRRLVAGFSALGLTSLPSATNFVTVSFQESAISAGEVEAELAARGILVRWLRNYDMEGFLRVTIGTDAEIDQTLRALEEVLT